MNSLLQFIKGRLREFKREPSALIFVILFPILWMLLLGHSMEDSKTIQIKVGVEKGFELTLTDPRLQVVLTADQDLLQERLDTRRLDIILTKNKLLKFNEDQVSSTLGMKLIEELNLGYKIIPNHFPKTRYIDFLIPGLIALSIFSTSLFGTGMTLVANRREGLLKRYLTTPFKPSLFMLSHIIGRFIIMLLELSSILFAGWLFFDFQILKSNVLNLILVCLVGTMMATSMAILLASKTRDGGFYNGMVNLISLPSMFLAGVWFSRDHFPLWIAEIAKYFPLSLFVDSLRAVILDDRSIVDISGSLMILLILSLICTTWAKLRFKWY